jgi:hypothetical protein
MSRTYQASPLFAKSGSKRQSLNAPVAAWLDATHSKAAREGRKQIVDCSRSGSRSIVLALQLDVFRRAILAASYAAVIMVAHLGLMSAKPVSGQLRLTNPSGPPRFVETRGVHRANLEALHRDRATRLPTTDACRGRASQRIDYLGVRSYHHHAASIVWAG